MNDTVAIIGLGNAGAALARGLSGKFPLCGYDVRAERRDVVADLDLDWRDSIDAAIGEADFALLSLPRPEISREVVVAITEGQLDFGPWEQIHYAEFDGKRRKRVLVKIIGQ